MVTANCPRLVIAGTGSGVGKTSLTLGLARALVRQGLRVQTFKVGPDFLDPTYLAKTSGRPCYNLDGWMTSREYVRGLFARATADADIALIEGVMGMFDGASPRSLEGSTAEIAIWLDAPVLLVANVHGVARSLAATVAGFARFEPGIRLAGVIANQSGSERHRALLAEALAGAGLPPVVGAVPRGAIPALPGRHLGLVAAEQSGIDAAALDQFADCCVQHTDLPLLVGLARSAGATEIAGEPVPLSPKGRRVRLGIARDEAFHFYYADNLEALEAAGAELVSFSPLADTALADDLDALYLGGGYPEVHAEQLAANTAMLGAVRRFAATGRSIYAECGGLMYLGRTVQSLDGRRLPLAGVLPVDTAMRPTLKTLGYVEAAMAGPCLWGAAGQTCRGHEFHYSEIATDEGPTAGWQPAYTIRRRAETAAAREGFVRGNVMAGYVHLHWASRPDAVRHFISCCEKHP
jgi:cobyrinic acid a,c-diamide synthase